MNDFLSNGERTREVAVKGLAVIGFFALVGGALWLAVYSTRYIPTVVNNIAGAAVYLGSVLIPSNESPELSVVSPASTTISFGTPENSTPVPPSPATTTATPTATPAPAPTPEPIGPIFNELTPATPNPSGYADLTVRITSVGYASAVDGSSGPQSFVESNTVPAGKYPAVRFTVTNSGTNWSGTWRISASIPTREAIYSESMPSLAPGQNIPEGFLVFDRAIKGADQTISILVNSDNTALETNTNNNSASAKLTIL